MAERGRRVIGAFGEFRRDQAIMLAHLEDLERRVAALEQPWWRKLWYFANRCWRSCWAAFSHRS